MGIVTQQGRLFGEVAFSAVPSAARPEMYIVSKGMNPVPRKGTVVAAHVSVCKHSCYAIGKVVGRREAVPKYGAAAIQVEVIGYWYDAPNQLSHNGSCEGLHSLKGVNGNAPVYVITGAVRERLKKAYEFSMRKPL